MVPEEDMRRYEFQEKLFRTIVSVEADAHNEEDPMAIAVRVMKACCDFYDADWCGILIADLQTQVFIPEIWYDSEIGPMQDTLFNDIEFTEEFATRSAAIAKDPKWIPDISIFSQPNFDEFEYVVNNSERLGLPGNELSDALSTCYDQDGIDETIVICRSNKRANIYNQGIRSQILWREEELEGGDLLMVAKNNYYWTEKEKDLDFIANGETAVVRRVRRTTDMYGFRFADVLLSFPDWQDVELETRLLLDTLHSDAPALSREDNERLFQSVLEDYVDVPLKKERMKKMKADPYYNALQVKYAYAVTCHKAQGGQWKNVFLDQGYITDDHLTPDYFRWLYTAFTRATGMIYLVNYPTDRVE